MDIPKITPSELNWVREKLEDILRGVYRRRKAVPYLVAVTRFTKVRMPPLDADEEPPVIDEELLERCLLSNDWFHKTKYVGNRSKVRWSEQATNLLAMKARGISYRRCGEHFGVSAERARSVLVASLFSLRDLALLGRLTQEPTPSVWARIKAKISGGE